MEVNSAGHAAGVGDGSNALAVAADADQVSAGQVINAAVAAIGLHIGADIDTERSHARTRNRLDALDIGADAFGQVKRRRHCATPCLHGSGGNGHVRQIGVACIADLNRESDGRGC